MRKLNKLGAIPALALSALILAGCQAEPSATDDAGEISSLAGVEAEPNAASDDSSMAAQSLTSDGDVTEVATELSGEEVMELLEKDGAIVPMTAYSKCNSDQRTCRVGATSWCCSKDQKCGSPAEGTFCVD